VNFRFGALIWLTPILLNWPPPLVQKDIKWQIEPISREYYKNYLQQMVPPW